MELGSASAGTSESTTVCMPFSIFTFATRLTSAPRGKTVTASTRDVTGNSAAHPAAGQAKEITE
jgi:hypothetical protein